MADSKRALVLHVSTGGEPLVFALSEQGASDLDTKLTDLLAEGKVYAPALADGSTVAVNFAHVATAHLDELPPLARVYGSGQPKRHGFAT
ncbi:hypothetical protein BLA60_27055 [Actinophytocola xinjiangensis]|uniref:Uncharacterized protein n=1 Tax=Actinophytocola xinjiangensis TaxID=485602 RepID=A0A7Z0WHT9_9PSEU|nr:hypothetical protein [Actinophytocola xinjiangensis]OLF07578.1 hypothetical protein BLA60_27055 [Actinophytocola xinjiangensis]